MMALLKLMRPHQWVKNSFVFAGVLFGHAWSDTEKLSQALWAFAAFSLFASAVYVMNDLVDREQDRLHPRKRSRPLAAGTVSITAALLLAGVCLLGGSVIALYFAGSAPWVFFAYLAINAAYSFRLKHVVILDVFLISSGFMLRLLAGTLGIGIEPSQWLLLCGLMLTLFLGFGKRLAELRALEGDSGGHRRVLDDYTEPMLEQFITIAAAGTLVAYALYTVSAETVAMHGTRSLMYTVPFVLYGLLRYLWRVQQQGGGGDPAQELLTDRHVLITTVCWLALVGAILKGLV